MQAITRFGPNIQSTRTWYHSTQTGGPVTLSFPNTDFIVLSDNPTTGDIVYSVPTNLIYDELCVGRVVYIIKTETTGPVNGVEIHMPIGMTFNTTGTNILRLTDNPTTLSLCFPPNGNIGVLQGLGSGGGGAVSTLYTQSDFITSDRTVDAQDKNLDIQLSLPGSRFYVAKDTSSFPPPTETAAVFVEPDDFVGSGKPAAMIGYSITPDPNNDSVGVLCSQVTGAKSVMVVCTKTADSIQHMINVADSGMTVLASQLADNTQFDILPTKTNIASDAIFLIRPPPTNTLATELLARNPLSNELEVMPVASLPPPAADNIYTVDGILTADRTMTMDGSNLTIKGTGVETIEFNNVDTFRASGVALEFDHKTASLVASSTVTIATPRLDLITAPPIDLASTELLARDPVTGEVELMPVAALPPGPSTNIYNADGAFTSNRTGTLAGNNLTITATTGSIVLQTDSGVVDLVAGNTGAVRLLPTLQLTLGVPGATVEQEAGLLYFQNAFRDYANQMVLRDFATDRISYSNKVAFHGAATTAPILNPAGVFNIAPLSVTPTGTDTGRFDNSFGNLDDVAGTIELPFPEIGIYFVEIRVEYYNSGGSVATPDVVTIDMIDGGGLNKPVSVVQSVTDGNVHTISTSTVVALTNTTYRFRIQNTNPTPSTTYFAHISLQKV